MSQSYPTPAARGFLRWLAARGPQSQLRTVNDWTTVRSCHRRGLVERVQTEDGHVWSITNEGIEAAKETRNAA